MSDKTATERLRALLDERDEYYRTSGNKTWWGRPIDAQTGKPINVFHNQAQPMGEDRLLVELQLATPEQAIAATLGSFNCSNGERTETCHDKNGFDPELGFECTVCGAMVDTYMVTPIDMGHVRQFKYCPFCGRRVRVVDE